MAGDKPGQVQILVEQTAMIFIAEVLWPSVYMDGILQIMEQKSLRAFLRDQSKPGCAEKC